MSWWKWSRTAASNATADSTINWAEGQAPSSVNDSARAMMAAAAKFTGDISGAIATSGTSTAYTMTSYQVYDTLAHMDGAMIAFTPHATSGATPTLNVDGLGGKPLRSAPSVELPSGTLVQGTPYVATYYNSTTEWILQGFFASPYIVPIGAMLPYIWTSAPNSAFVLPFGQAISRTTYSTLFALVGTTYGVGDTTSTFNIPDMRGRVMPGYDNMGGSSASRITTAFAGVGGAETVTVAQANLPVVNFTGSNTITVNLAFVPVADGGGNYNAVDGGGNTTRTVSQSLPSAAASGTNTITVSAGGSGTALNKMPPHLVGSYILRII